MIHPRTVATTPDKKAKEEPPSSAPSEPTTKVPLVFISHDSQDAELAEAFSKLLSSVSAGVLKTFRSSDRKGSQGIEYGVEWYPELMKKLATASDVVCLLTQRSVERPWILYEAGVAKGKLDTPVLGVALGVPLSTASTGPFAQFQNSDDNEDALTKLVVQLLGRIPGSEPDPDVVRPQVRVFKDRISKLLEKTPTKRSEKTTGDSELEPSVPKLFEEIKVMFQDLPNRIQKTVAEGPVRGRRVRRISPTVIGEIVNTFREGPDNPVTYSTIASVVRGDFPWLADMLYGISRSMESGNAMATERQIRTTLETLSRLRHGPLVDILDIDDSETYAFVSEIMHFLDYSYDRLHRRQAKRHVKSGDNS